MPDPNQNFIVSQMSRHTIAVELNEHLESLEATARLSMDDERLTDAVCAKYAARIGDITTETEDQAAEQAEEIRHDTLADLGLLPVRMMEEGTVTVTVTLALRKRPGKEGREFNRQEAEMHTGQCVELAVRDYMQSFLDNQDAPFRVSLEGVKSELQGEED